MTCVNAYCAGKHNTKQASEKSLKIPKG